MRAAGRLCVAIGRADIPGVHLTRQPVGALLEVEAGAAGGELRAACRAVEPRAHPGAQCGRLQAAQRTSTRRALKHGEPCLLYASA